jgi:hypothetical protein
VFRENRTIIAYGNDFDASWAAAHTALQTKGYVVDTEQRSNGQIVTVKRANKDWWWIMNVHVQPDGQVEFRCSGSPSVNPSPNKIHRRLLNFSVVLQRAFAQALARGN